MGSIIRFSYLAVFMAQITYRQCITCYFLKVF